MNYRIGDTVQYRRKMGVIARINNSGNWPICVDFSEGNNGAGLSFTTEGYYFEKANDYLLLIKLVEDEL